MLTLIHFFVALSWGSPDPYLIENKISHDLEESLSKMIAREQFLVQVNSVLNLKAEKRLIEGETTIDNFELKRANNAPVMPGFNPEPEALPPVYPNSKTREIYRTVESPEVSLVRVRVSFDNGLSKDIVAKAKKSVQEYLDLVVPGKSVLSFSLFPMYKEKPAPMTATPPASNPNTASEPKPVVQTPAELLWHYTRWLIPVLLMAIFLLQVRRSGTAPQIVNHTQVTKSPESTVTPSTVSPMTAKSSTLNSDGGFIRHRLIQKFLMRSDAFRNFFLAVPEVDRQTLTQALDGAAFRNLLDGLAIHAPKVEPGNQEELDEKIINYEKSFDDFVQVKDWQEQQFFGFLQSLSREQLLAIANQELEKNVCVMFRFLPASSSAEIIDLLSSERRKKVFSFITVTQNLSYTDLMSVERELRIATQKLPKSIYRFQKENPEYWENVINESNTPDTLMKELESTEPTVYNQVSSHLFRIEDIVTLDPEIVTRVLAEMNNDELCLALLECPEGITQKVLDMLTPQRKEAIQPLFISYKKAPKEQIRNARVELRKRFREALAA